MFSIDMESERFYQALSRLETAIARLESAARAAAPDGRLAELEESHRKLREGASEALSRLDQLIAAVPHPSIKTEA